MSEKKYAVGIDIGGTSIKHGLCSGDGDLICWDSVDTQADAPKEKILDSLAEILKTNLRIADQKKIGVSAAGIGTPGSVDIQRGFLMGATPNFVYWRDVPISEYLVKNRMCLFLWITMLI